MSANKPVKLNDAVVFVQAQITFLGLAPMIHGQGRGCTNAQFKVHIIVVDCKMV